MADLPKMAEQPPLSGPSEVTARPEQSSGIESNSVRTTLSQLQAWTAATRDITTALLAGTPTGEVLRQITDWARTLSRSRRAFLAVAPDPDSPLDDITGLVITHWSGPGPELRPDRALSIEGTVIGTAFRERTTARDDLGELFPGAGPALIVPVHTADSALGVLAVLREAGAAPYSAEIVELVTAFTDQAALAMQLAQAQQRIRVVDILTDRDRIAHDLHDHVIQQLFAIGLTLQGTIPRVQSSVVRVRLTGIVNDLQDVVQEIRTSIFELHGGDRHGTQLRERLDTAIRRQAAHGEVRTSLRVNGPLSVVGAELADQTEAVVREAVGKAVRLGGASSVEVEIGVADDLTVIVTDDGRGIEPDGLTELRRRAERSGGRFEVRAVSSPHSGTRLYWSVPLR